MAEAEVLRRCPGSHWNERNAWRLGAAYRPVRLFGSATALAKPRKSNERRPPTEADLLLLLRMKCRLSRLQFSDQRLNPFNRDLIANRQAYSPVMLNLFVQFVALVAHGNLLEPRNPLRGRLMVKRAGMGICSRPSVSSKGSSGRH